MILNIDTSLEVAKVALSGSGIIVQEAENRNKKDHGAFLQPAIQSILQQASVKIAELDAVAVVSGPGSYTGLRVGMATAKGICYTIQKPLITITTLHLLAYQAILENRPMAEEGYLFCPMIDARRMEVFTALYDKDLNLVEKESAQVLDQNSLSVKMINKKILFFGNGAKKWQEICFNKNAFFSGLESNVFFMCRLSFKKYQDKIFENLAYSEPFYVKEFYNGGV